MVGLFGFLGVVARGVCIPPVAVVFHRHRGGGHTIATPFQGSFCHIINLAHNFLPLLLSSHLPLSRGGFSTMTFQWMVIMLSSLLLPFFWLNVETCNVDHSLFDECPTIFKEGTFGEYLYSNAIGVRACVHGRL